MTLESESFMTKTTCSRMAMRMMISMMSSLVPVLVCISSASARELWLSRQCIYSSTWVTGSLEIRRTADNHNGIDTLSRSVLVNCEEGEEVFVKLEEGSLYSDPDSNLLSFMGFPVPTSRRYTSGFCSLQDHAIGV